MREIDPIVELAVNEKLEKERTESNSLYCTWVRFNLVEKIVFTSVGLALLAMATKLITIVIPK